MVFILYFFSISINKGQSFFLIERFPDCRASYAVRAFHCSSDSQDCFWLVGNITPLRVSSGSSLFFNREISGLPSFLCSACLPLLLRLPGLFLVGGEHNAIESVKWDSGHFAKEPVGKDKTKEGRVTSEEATVVTGEMGVVRSLVSFSISISDGHW